MTTDILRYRGPKVSYEVSIRWSKAARDRLMLAVVRCRAEIRDTFQQSPEMLVTIVKFDHTAHPEFLEIAKPWHCQYRSPTRFDNGTLRPIYRSPEEETAAKLRELEERRKLEEAGL